MKKIVVKLLITLSVFSSLANIQIRVRTAPSAGGSNPISGFPMVCDTEVSTLTNTNIATAYNTTAVSGTVNDPYIICLANGSSTGGNITLSATKNYVTFVGGGGNPTVWGLAELDETKDCSVDDDGCCHIDSSACPTETVINGMFIVNGSGARGLRFTGMKFFTQANVQWEPTGPYDWIFDYNWIINNSGANRKCWHAVDYYTQRSYGLVRRVFSQECQWQVEPDPVYSSGGVTGRSHNTMWAEANNIGTANQVVYENSYFYKATPSVGGYFNCFDAKGGGAYTVRFSVLDGCRTEAHSIQGAGRGTKATEFYHLRITGADNIQTFFIRGGSSMIWNNFLDDSSMMNRTLGKFDNQRDFTTDGTCGGYPTTCTSGTGLNGQLSVYPNGPDHCTGVAVNTGSYSPGPPSGSPDDGNQMGREGFPCLDQIGTIQDSAAWTSWWNIGGYTAFGSTGQGLTQSMYGLYAWHNRDNDNGGKEMTVSLTCPSCTAGDAARMAGHLVENEVWWEYNSSYNGTTEKGVGEGNIGDRPTACTLGDAWWATDEGEWNSRNGATSDGKLYICTATGTPGTWTAKYGANSSGLPLAYPHPRAQ